MQITLKVPGGDAPALRSRSSSFNNVANGARSSVIELVLDGAGEATPINSISDFSERHC